MTCSTVGLGSALAAIRQQETRFYVYVIRKPDGSPFYVGKGKGRRIAGHEEYAKRPRSSGRKASTIKGIWNKGLSPGYEIIAFFDDEAEAFAKEMALIIELGRVDCGTGPLTNVSVGGEGNADRVVSEETRQKLSSRVFSNEAQARYKAILRSPATIAKRLEAEQRRKANVALAQKDPNGRAKRGASLKEFLRSNPDALEFRCEHLRAMQTDPLIREKQSNALRKGWADPVVRARRIAGLKKAARNPELLAKRRQQSKAKWSDPAARARQSIACREGRLRYLARKKAEVPRGAD